MDKQKELNDLNVIDTLTTDEIVDGDAAVEGDGVDLSIIGSDFDEEGECQSDEEGNPNSQTPKQTERRRVSSKVVKVRTTSHQTKHRSRSRSRSRPRSKSKHGSKSEKSNKFSHLKDDPEFRDFLKEILGDRGKNERLDRDFQDENHYRRKRSSSTRSRSRSRSRDRFRNRDKDRNRVMVHNERDRLSSSRKKGSGDWVADNRDSSIREVDSLGDIDVQFETVPVTAKHNNHLIKSPSDTTLFSPGLRKATNKDDLTMIEKISKFVEGIRLDSNRAAMQLPMENHNYNSVVDSNNCDNRKVRDENSASTSGYRRRSIDSARGIPATPHSRGTDVDLVSDQLLMQAEKFRARVEVPKGNFNNYSEMIMPYDYDKLRSKFVRPEGLGPIDREIMFLRNFDQDDEFFHVTSQIEPCLRSKIEKGEFVELEQLLPKDRVVGGKNEDLNRQLYQLITQGTNNFVDPPVPKTGKINSIRKWDQAFRVYAAIYTNANPERASEIWQYVYVIHTAAAANHWDNMYYYDINFRELMASKPWRSWGKTYTQGWNMAFNNAVGSSGFAHSHNNSNGNSMTNNYKSNRDWKDECCWRFNKNRCKRSGTECNYDHRCTYCAGWGHGFYNCRKRQNKNTRRSSGNGFPAKSNSSPKKSSPSAKK